MARNVSNYDPYKSGGYVVDEYVHYDGSLYRCKLDTPKPAGAFNDTYWNLIGYLLSGEGMVEYIDDTLNYHDRELFATAEDLDKVNAKANTINANLNTEITNRTSADETLQTNINTVNTNLNSEISARQIADNNILAKFQVVSALPAEIDPDTFYFIKQ